MNVRTNRTTLADCVHINTESKEGDAPNGSVCVRVCVENIKYTTQPLIFFVFCFYKEPSSEWLFRSVIHDRCTRIYRARASGLSVRISEIM